MGLDMFMRKLNKRVDEETLIEVNPVISSLENENDMKKLVSDYCNMSLEEFSKTYLSHSFYCNFEERNFNEVLAKKNGDMSFSELLEMRKIENLSEEEFKDYEKKRIVNLYKDTKIASEGLYEETKRDLELIDKHRDFLTGLERKKVGYWRKHSDLNGLMADIHYNDRCRSEEFNCIPLILCEEDIRHIINIHEDHLSGVEEVEHTPGFFWGKTDREDWVNSLEDFKRFLKETDFENETLVYSCWW